MYVAMYVIVRFHSYHGTVLLSVKVCLCLALLNMYHIITL